MNRPPTSPLGGSAFAGSEPEDIAGEAVKDERQRVTILYTGNVQGVGFRYATRGVAEGFDVCGTVRNLPDGRVELVAEGSMREVDSFRRAIRESGVGSLIRKEVAEVAPPRGDLRGFQILR
ncbi:MAG: acylphosphatase [Limisphaerales bacterium]